MKVPLTAEWLRQRHGRFLGISLSMLAASTLLIALNQVLAALLVVVVGALVLELEQRNARARALAERLATRQALEKFEVPRGAWGELCRAINTIVQEQRTHDRLHAATPHTLADDSVRALIDGSSAGMGTQRTVAILLVSCMGSPSQAMRQTRPSVSTWQALAHAAQSTAREQGALLQPCGDAIMLVFGAFAERPLPESLLAALGSGDTLRTAWQHTGATLAMSVTTGNVMVTNLPGLGCCVIGAPIEHAIQIERLAVASPFYRLLCDETAYYAIRHHYDSPLHPTEFRIQTDSGRPQIVYGVQSAVFLPPAAMA